GGNVDDGESLLDAIRREIVEETGIEPKVGRLLYVNQFSHGGTDFIDFIFHIENAADYLDIDLAATTHGTEELEKIDFINPKDVYILPEFLKTDDLAGFITSGQPTKIFSN